VKGIRVHEELRKLWKIEDYWAVWLGLGIVLLALVAYSTGSTIAGWAVKPGGWSNLSQLASDLGVHAGGYLVIFLVFGVVFTLSMVAMGRNVAQFVPGFIILFLGSVAVFYLSTWDLAKKADLGAPLLALLIGLVIGNLVKLPSWFQASLLTEYYIKTGIVLLGATLPLTLIFRAGWVAFLQATIVSVCTWLTIFLAATKIFGLEKRFGAVLGAGGAVCGVSASIAVGGAVKAKKDHIAISIAIVSVWAIVMIIILSIVLKFMVPGMISPGEAGAWTGTSEFADAAGFAVVAELSAVIERGGIVALPGQPPLNADDPINTFTLMKVIGRDIWIGIWCLILAVVSVVFWEKRDASEKAVGAGIIWERFPKFVLGFFAASIIMTAVTSDPPENWVGRAQYKGTFKSKTEKISYDADFSDYTVPTELSDRVTVTTDGLAYANAGRPMSLEEFELLKSAVRVDDTNRSDKVGVFKQLRYASDWFESDLREKVIDPVKNLRSWAFVLCFLCIGLSTRFADLLTFGLKPFWAFTIGVAVNVPLGYFLSTVVFSRFWSNISALM
jgi:uncharacterized membrane protein YadS